MGTAIKLRYLSDDEQDVIMLRVYKYRIITCYYDYLLALRLFMSALIRIFRVKTPDNSNEYKYMTLYHIWSCWWLATNTATGQPIHHDKWLVGSWNNVVCDSEIYVNHTSTVKIESGPEDVIQGDHITHYKAYFSVDCCVMVDKYIKGWRNKISLRQL